MRKGPGSVYDKFKQFDIFNDWQFIKWVKEIYTPYQALKQFKEGTSFFFCPFFPSYCSFIFVIIHVHWRGIEFHVSWQFFLLVNAFFFTILQRALNSYLDCIFLYPYLTGYPSFPAKYPVMSTEHVWTTHKYTCILKNHFGVCTAN